MCNGCKKGLLHKPIVDTKWVESHSLLHFQWKYAVRVKISLLQPLFCSFILNMYIYLFGGNTKMLWILYGWICIKVTKFAHHICATKIIPIMHNINSNIFQTILCISRIFWLAIYIERESLYMNRLAINAEHHWNGQRQLCISRCFIKTLFSLSVCDWNAIEF